MRIGIIAAMELELAELKKLLFIECSMSYAKMSFNTCHYNGDELILVCSGQGKTNSAVATQLLVDKYAIDSVINIGICGGISSNSKLGDVYVGEKYVHYDIRKKQSVSKFPHQSYYLVDSELCAKFLSLDCPIKVGIFGTGEGFVTETDMRERLIHEFGIDCVDMESTAIAQVCYLNEVAFISVRVVTDNGDVVATKTTEVYQEKAMKQIVDSLIQSLDD